MNRHHRAQKATPTLALSIALLASLAACGGGTSPDSATPSATASDTASSASQSSGTGASLDGNVVAAMAQTEVTPAYHMAPALLDEPDESDVGGTSASARFAPKTYTVDNAAAGLDTARLSRDTLIKRIAEASKARVASTSGDSTAPQATTITGAVYTPAQIRAAYGLAALPAAGAAISPTLAAQLGAGQTIYIIDAYHDATALSDLNLFSAKFGLPTCANVTIPATAALPLAKPPSSCTFSQVNATTTAAMTATVPVFNGSWAPESKLDVQWAHAIAPLARIVLIEMPSSLSSYILGANLLATKMGPGVVSMSFGSTEAGWAPTTDSYFAGAGMTYVAAAGDAGSEVLWPAVSPHVLAVGGTGLKWSGSGTRYEAAWAYTGGGLSAYESLPAWQSGVVPAGGSALVRRAVPDVAFNANPMTGEYVALTLPGAATVWSSYGGTSIAAPQWAGIVAVANAQRAANSKAVLGDFHSLLYQSIGKVPGTYAASFGDIVDGTNGTCATCRAGTGYDQATGWGTPNSAQLMQQLAGTTATPATTASTPVISGTGRYSGTAGKAFTYTLTASNPNSGTLSWSINGAPAGLSVSTGGTLNWAAPVAGSYWFNAVVTDSSKHSSTQTQVLTITAAAVAPAATPSTPPSANHAPTLAAATYSVAAGSTFSTMLNGKDVDGGTLSYAIAGAPSGMKLLSSGFLYWTAPVKGTYPMTVTVRDSAGAAVSAPVKLIVS